MKSRGSILAIALIVAGAVAIAVGVALGRSNRNEDNNPTDATSSREIGSLPPIATSFRTMPPTPLPTPSPTKPPTKRPTARPTAPPTKLPTLRPTARPTKRPTRRPTVRPTPAPVTPPPTRRPTAPPLPSNYSFRLKLYWTFGYYWQESYLEKEWCLECVACDPITDSAFGEGCKDKNGVTCERGDQLWVQRCKKNGGNAVFQLVQDGKQGDMLKIKGSNLCVERVGTKYIALERCDPAAERQRWLGFRPNGEKFEWKPLEPSTSRCVTQHHHPKATEIVYCSDCRLAHKWDTGYWSAY